MAGLEWAPFSGTVSDFRSAGFGYSLDSSLVQVSLTLLAPIAPQSKRAKPSHTSTLKASALLTSPLTKASHMANLNINRAGEKILPIVGRITKPQGKEHEWNTGRYEELGQKGNNSTYYRV